MNKVLLLLGISVVTSGCASVHYQELAELPRVSDDKGLIFFFREKEFQGSAISFYIYEGDERIGGLANGTFFFIEPNPGTYTYRAKTEAEEKVTLEVVAGETYYIKAEVKMGIWVGQPDLTIVHDLEGKSEIPNLKYAVIRKDGEDSVAEGVDGTKQEN